MLKYTYALHISEEATRPQQEFLVGFLDALDSSSLEWNLVTSGQEIPEVTVIVGLHEDPGYQMFEIQWNESTSNMTIEQYTMDAQRHKSSCTDLFGTSTFVANNGTQYYEYLRQLNQVEQSNKNTKYFFPSLNRLYSKDTPYHYGHAFGYMLNDIMLVESIHSKKEEYV